MEYRHPKNSVETCSDDDNLSLDSPNTPASALESVPKQVLSKKAKYRKFYQSQKTLIPDSTESSVDNPEVGFDNQESSPMDHIDVESVSSWMDHSELEHSNIPEIIEDLITRSEEDDSISQDNATDYSDLNINCTEKFRILMDLDNPGIQTSLKSSNSLVSINNVLGQPTKNNLEVECNTSDEDISDIGSDIPSPLPPRRKLRISLRNLSDSDDNDLSMSTGDSVLAPSKNYLQDDDMPTDESDVEVTDMDYYKIRHQNDKVPKTEYSLSWSPTKFAPVYEKPTKQNEKFSKNISSFQAMKIPNYPSIDIPDMQDYNKNEDETDDEDVPCSEDDFMTLEEFMGAHDTDFDLMEGKGRTKVKISANKPRDYDEYDDFDDEDTESVHESMLESSEADDYSEDTDISEIETSYTENGPEYNDVGKIVLMEHDELEGTVAVFSPGMNKKLVGGVNKRGFQPEVADFKDEMDNQDAEIEMIKTGNKDDSKKNDDTDSEAMSGSEVGSVISVIPVPEQAIPKVRRKILQISETRDGATVMTERDLKKSKNSKKKTGMAKEVEPLTDVENIEDYRTRGFDEPQKKFPFFQPQEVEDSKVYQTQRNKMRTRKVKKVEPAAVHEEI